MKNSSRIISLVLALALLAPIASAAISVTTYSHEAQFNAAPQQTKVCACGQTTDYFTINNLGDFPASYQVSLDASQPWIWVSRNHVDLQPGEATQVAVTLQPPCGTTGTSHYNIYATSQFGRYRAANRDITVEACQPIGLSVQQLDDNVLPCRPIRYEVTVQNTATYTETYNLSADTSAQVLFSRRSFALAPGENETVDAVARFSCSEYGNKQVVFVAHADKTGVSQSHVSDVHIQWDYEFALTTNQQAVCAEVTTPMTVHLANTAQTANTYTLNVDGPYWATLGVTNVSLAPGQSVDIPVTLRPHKSDLGTQDLRITAKALLGGTTHTLDAPLQVQDCYEQVVQSLPAQQTACAGPTNVTVQVQNRGMYAQNFTVTSSGDIYSHPVQSRFWLRPGEHKDVTLQMVIPDRTQTYDVTATATQSSGISTTTHIPVHAVSNADCTMVAPENTKYKVYTDAKVVPILITNTGIDAATYAVQWNSPLFRLNTTSVFLAPGEQAVLHLIPTNLSQNQGTTVGSLVLTSPRSQYRYDMSFQVSQKSWLTSAYESIAFGAAGSLDWCLLLVAIGVVLVVLALIVLLLTYTGVLPKISFKEASKPAIVTVLLALMVLSLIVAAILASQVTVPQQLAETPHGTNASALYYEVPQGNVLTINLAKYFYDPDLDNLTFTSSQPQHMAVRIENTTAYLKPQSGFFGEEHVVFTATDNKGASTDSPVMTVRVLRLVPHSFGDYVSLFCGPIFFALLALLFVLCAIYAVMLPHKKLEERYGKPVRELVAGSQAPVVRVEQTPEQVKGPTVHGDVIAGDKVINQAAPKKEVFVTSEGGKRIHRAECPIAQRISKEKRVVYKSREEALKGGYSPCRLCRPFDE